MGPEEELMVRWKRKFDINERKVKRKKRLVCRERDFQKIRERMKDDFLKEVFNYLQSKLRNGETLYRFYNCKCDGMLKLQNGNILFEVKGGKLNWSSQCVAMTELMIASELVKQKWNEKANGYWIIAEDFTKGQGWARTLDYPLEYHRFIKDAFGFDIRLLQYKKRQLTEIVS